MSGLFGNPVAGSAIEGAAWAAVGAWSALQVGSAPMPGRQWMEIQVKGPTSLAIGYSNKNTNGTYTAPTDNVRNHIIIPANSIKVLPVGDGITVYGQAILKGSNTGSGSKIAIVEFK